MAAVFPASQVIVVGGGLAGMSAANQAVECGGRTVLLDKSSFCGGNPLARQSFFLFFPQQLSRWRVLEQKSNEPMTMDF